MKDGNSKKSKLSWSKKLIRKWFNFKNKSEEFQADEAVYGGGDVEWRNSFSEREPSTVKKSKTEKSTKNIERSFSRSRSRSRRGRGYLDHPQIINIQNYSLFVSTWNVGGKSPSSNMKLDDWLHSAPPADIYVLGFQEIVPLNAGNILGAEDNGPAKKWLSLIKKTLNNAPGTSGCSGRYTPSPVPNPVAEWNADFEGSNRHKASTFFPRRSFQTPQCSRMENDMSVPQPRLDRRFSVCDRVIFGHRPSDVDPSMKWGYRPSDCSSSHRPSDYSSGPRASDYSSSRRPATIRGARGQVIFLDGVRTRIIIQGLAQYSSVLSNVVHHLTSGQKEGDELRRNADFMEILRKTRFPRVNGNAEKSPETILQHDRILWLGDLNYRIALPYRSAKALIAMQNWRALLEKDQLRIEQRRGRVFDGWKEGKIYFPPTYKYSHNSDRYAGDDMHPKEKRRTPAWCDRILWYGNGLQQLSYIRGESRFSDHRPVSSVFWAEIESAPNRLRKSMSCSSSRIEVEELLPYSHGYTELCFF
ncbi:hypothetical protein DH2020_049067 [Rehmannia glutinosa]|uniref:Inositol polyphosphate-related phosphatase domain-containing protein n=1 Tax=Rehmannia glutinosa TaxID=99300 RepID=A0ABR0U3V4_REHGL